MKLADGRNLSVQEPTFTLIDGNLSLTVPIYINNTGLYDISDVYVKIKIFKADTLIAALSKSLPDIPAGQIVNTSFVTATSLKDIFQRTPTLLNEDTNLNLNAVLHFKVARIITFNVAYNSSILWGAPFHNLTVYGVTYNDTRHILSFHISFNNNAAFSLKGSLTTELLNSNDETVGTALLVLDVPPRGAYHEIVEVFVDPSEMTDEVLIRLFFADLKIFERWASP
ncbi:MAG: hypothetical protein QXZ68_01780 [Candidatus Bathyarchaeia archaeon]